MHCCLPVLARRHLTSVTLCSGPQLVPSLAPWSSATVFRCLFHLTEADVPLDTIALSKRVSARRQAAT
jgi:hypothetical protein